jgi:hypothetical protein
MVFLFLGLRVTQEGGTIKLSIVLREASAVLLPAERISRSNYGLKESAAVGWLNLSRPETAFAEGWARTERCVKGCSRCAHHHRANSTFVVGMRQRADWRDIAHCPDIAAS